MSLQEVLAASQDQKQLVAALERVNEAGKRVELDAQGVQAMVKQLLQAGSPGAGIDGLRVAGLLLRVTVDGAELEDSVQRSLLELRYAPALVTLVERGAEVVRQHKQPPPGAEEALEQVLNALGDVATLSAGGGLPGISSGKAKRGRDVHGSLAMPQLVDFLMAPTEGGAWASAKRCASCSLLEYLANSRANCGLLTAIHGSAALFGDLLTSCGDVACQIDVLEAAYRCTKAGVLTAKHRALFSARILTALDGLAGQSVKGGGLDLAAELRKLLVLYNREAHSPTVYSVQAGSLAVCGIEGLAAPGCWVDFGLHTLALSLLIPDDDEESGEGGGGGKPELEIIQFPYSDVTRVQTSSGTTTGYDKLTLQLSCMPVALHKLGSSFQGATLVMQLRRADLAALPARAPRVAAAMRAAGVAFAQDGTLSGGGNGGVSEEGSQRSRKCSAGFTVYGAGNKQEGAGPGRSSGRAPLQLTRSGHTPGVAGNAPAQQPLQQHFGLPKPAIRRGTSPAPPLPLQRSAAPPPPSSVAAAAAPTEGASDRVQQENQEQPAAEVQIAEEGLGGEPAAVPKNDVNAQVDAHANNAAPAASRQREPPIPAGRPRRAIEAASHDTGTVTAAGGSQRGGRPLVIGKRGGSRASQRPAQTTSAPQPSAAGHVAQVAEVGEVNSPPPRADAPAEARQQPEKEPAPDGAARRTNDSKQHGAASARLADGMEGKAAAHERGNPQAEVDEDAEEDNAPPPAAANKDLKQQQSRRLGSKKAAKEEEEQAHKEVAADQPPKAHGAAAKQQAGRSVRRQAIKGPAKAAAGQAGPKPSSKGTAGQRGRAGARKAKAASPEDPIEDTAPEDDSNAEPSPSWLEAGVAKQGKAASGPESDSESELHHDHASRQPFYKAAAAEKGRVEAAQVAKANRKAAADEAEDHAEHSGQELEDERAQKPPPRKQQPAKNQRPTAAKKGAAANGNGGAAEASKAPAGVAGGRQRRAAATAAAAKLAANPDSNNEPVRKQQQGRPQADTADEDPHVFDFQLSAGKGRQAKTAAPAADGKRQAKSPFKVTRRLLGSAGKLAGKKRGRGADSPQAPEGINQGLAAGAAVEATAVDGGILDAEVLAESPMLSPVLAQQYPQVDLSPAVEESPVVQHGYEEQEVASPEQQDQQSDTDEEEEEEEEEHEEEEAPTGGYQSEGTGHLQGWTNFQPAERELPNMVVEPKELQGIAKRFKFTELKQAPAPAAVAASKPVPTTSASRSKAELKAAAAGVKKTGLEPLRGLSGAKPALKAARLTTMLSQGGLAPSQPASSKGKAMQGGAQETAMVPTKKQKQAAKAAVGAKRGIEALGQLSSVQKRARTGTAAASPKADVGGAAAKPVARGGGGRKAKAQEAVAPAAPTGAASGPEDSQQLSIHRLLTSVKHRQAAASQHDDDSEDDEGDDMAALQTFMVEVVRKRKAAAHRKQEAMVAELEAEVASAVAAQQKELQQAQQQLEATVSRKFGALEKQLDAKMHEIDGAATAFQQRLNCLWEEYRQLYNQVAAAATEAEAAAGKQSASAAACLESVRQTLSSRAAEVARKIERGSKKASKMPELAQMLIPFLD